MAFRKMAVPCMMVAVTFGLLTCMTGCTPRGSVTSGTAVLTAPGVYRITLRGSFDTSATYAVNSSYGGGGQGSQLTYFMDLPSSATQITFSVAFARSASGYVQDAYNLVETAPSSITFTVYDAGSLVGDVGTVTVALPSS